MTVSSAGFAKPAVEITLPWKYVCCTPSGMISGLPSLSRGSQRLGFTADTNVSHSYPPSEALQLVPISVVCSLFAHHVFPSETAHIQAHGWSSYEWYAACSCIICSQAKTAISKRMAGLLMGAGCSPFTSGYCCPPRGSWPPSAGLCIE